MEWNGVFAPQLRKSIGKVTYIPMWKMTHSDWKVLDWHALRDAAKNDIVAAAEKSRITGFMHVNFLQKGSQAAGYYIPVTASMLMDIGALMDNPPLRNSKDTALSKSATKFDVTIDQAGNLFLLYPKAAVAALMAKSLSEVLPDDEKKEAEDYVNQIAEENFDDLNELDVTLTWALNVLEKHDVEWLQEWVDEAEQILGEAEDKGLL